VYLVTIVALLVSQIGHQRPRRDGSDPAVSPDRDV
jgi:hypothetical protein